MKKRILLTLMVCLCSVAWAYDNTYAVVVGVADYKYFSAWDGDLRYTTSDAQRFANFLKSKKGGSVPAANIILLTDAMASKANILAQTRQLYSKAKKNDRVIFFFSGHGGRGCFLPYDAGKRGENMLYFSEVKSLFRYAKCNTKLLFADACFSGSMKGLNTKAIQSTLSKEQKAASDMNIAVMMSCRKNETSMELGSLRQGLFTYYLIEGLGGEANSDGSQYVTITELFNYVYLKTRQKASSMGHQQNPELFGKFDLRLIVAKT